MLKKFSILCLNGCIKVKYVTSQNKEQEDSCLSAGMIAPKRVH